MQYFKYLMKQIKQMVNRSLNKPSERSNFTDFFVDVVPKFRIRFAIGSADAIITILLSDKSQIVDVESKLLQKINLKFNKI